MAGPSGAGAPPSGSPAGDESRRARNLGVGCFTAIMGFFSGAMFGVLVARLVDFFAKAPKCDGIPSCNWAQFALGGALLGALSLPTLVLMRLRQSDAGADNSLRG